MAPHAGQRINGLSGIIFPHVRSLNGDAIAPIDDALTAIARAALPKLLDLRLGLFISSNLCPRVALARVAGYFRVDLRSSSTSFKVFWRSCALLLT